LESPWRTHAETLNEATGLLIGRPTQDASV
jgi:hypothetical protein